MAAVLFLPYHTIMSLLFSGVEGSKRPLMEGLRAVFSCLVLYFDDKDMFASMPTHTGRKTFY